MNKNCEPQATGFAGSKEQCWSFEVCCRGIIRSATAKRRKKEGGPGKEREKRLGGVRSG